jgi:hypothetical protein
MTKKTSEGDADCAPAPTSSKGEQSFLEMINHEHFPSVKKLKGDIKISASNESDFVEFFIPGNKHRKVPEIKISVQRGKTDISILFNGKPWNDENQRKIALQKAIKAYRAKSSEHRKKGKGVASVEEVKVPRRKIPKHQNATLALGKVDELRLIKIQAEVFKLCKESDQEISENWYCEVSHKEKERTIVVLRYEESRRIKGSVYFYSDKNTQLVGDDAHAANDELREEMIVSLEKQLFKKQKKVSVPA